MLYSGDYPNNHNSVTVSRVPEGSSVKWRCFKITQTGFFPEGNRFSARPS